MRYEWTYVAEPHQRQWVLKRNCALTPRQSGLSVGLLAMASALIAVVFAGMGAWPVVPFAGLEVAALAVAFLVYGRHAGDYERIVVTAGAVLVETASADRISRRQLPTEWVRVEYREGDRTDGQQLIRLVSGRQTLAIGRYVPDDRRATLARELRTSLKSLSAPRSKVQETQA